MKKLSQKEVDTRVRVLLRLKALLIEQKAKFTQYLKALELQQDEIQNDDTQAMSQHTILGEQILNNISALQKVIIPIQDMYNKCVGQNTKDPEVLAMQKELVILKDNVINQNKKNRAILAQHISNTRQQLLDLRNPYRNLHSVYSTNSASGSIVHINV